MKKYANPIRTSIICTALLLLIGCAGNDDDPETEPLEELEQVEVNVVYYNYTPRIDGILERLEYQIEFTNPNNVDIWGFYSIKQRSVTNGEALEFSTLSTDQSDCYQIPANTTCVLTEDIPGESFEVLAPDSMELLSVSYQIEPLD